MPARRSENSLIAPRASPRRHRDHGLDRSPDPRRIDLGVEAGDDATLDQRACADQAGRRGDADLLGQGVVRQPPLAAQHRDDPCVQLVELANILRHGSSSDVTRSSI
jgi:hypothetical protein